MTAEALRMIVIPRIQFEIPASTTFFENSTPDGGDLTLNEPIIAELLYQDEQSVPGSAIFNYQLKGSKELRKGYFPMSPKFYPLFQEAQKCIETLERRTHPNSSPTPVQRMAAEEKLKISLELMDRNFPKNPSLVPLVNRFRELLTGFLDNPNLKPY